MYSYDIANKKFIELAETGGTPTTKPILFKKFIDMYYTLHAVMH